MRNLVAAERMAKASALVRRYWGEPFTGRWFHELADRAHPDEITAADIVAVSTLGVTVPAGVAVWLLSDNGRASVAQLLADIPGDVDIWDDAALIAEDSRLWR